MPQPIDSHYPHLPKLRHLTGAVSQHAAIHFLIVLAEVRCHPSHLPGTFPHQDRPAWILYGADGRSFRGGPKPPAPEVRLFHGLVHTE